uniref:NocE n=1 Tax=Nocardia sp. ATCC 202099 TaxID=930400 RepID=E5DUH7_9NOCA|nr:NocE [Nocardia sp. ATCC 202099]
MLFRRGTIGLPALAGLVPTRTWELLAAADAERAVREPLRARLSDALHAVVPEVADAERRAVLKLRRDVHNDRVPASVPPLPGDLAERVGEWVAARRRGAELEALAEEVYAAELESARKALAAVALGEDFQRGVQLSGEDVHREVTAYAGDPFDTTRKPAKRRRAESTITSFAYRVVFKPSPFGAFTEIGAQPWGAAPAAGERVARARLSVGLLAWMTHQLHRVDGAGALLRVRLNNSLAVRGEHAVSVRRPLEGADDGFRPDQVIRAKNSPLVRVLVGLLADHDRTEDDLRARLVDAGLAADAAAGTIDQLVRAGLCHRGLGLPDQADRVAEEVASRLAAVGTAQALACAEVFTGLQAVEDAFADAPAARRTGLLAELRALVARFVEVVGCPPPAREAMRAALYEDVGTRAHADSWRPALLERDRENLDLLQRLVPLLDDAIVEKLGLYAFFADRFGEDHAGVPVVELYEAFSALSPAEASAVMCGVGDPHAQHVLALRRDFLGWVRDQRADGELVLDPAHLASVVDALPPTVVPWRSTAYRVQQADDLTVVNGITTGHGVFFSRYCDLLGGGRFDLAGSLRDTIARHTPRQADITAALGLNFNLHPRLTPLEVVYPGSVQRPGATGVLTLADLVVRADPTTRRLALWSTQDGERIDLAPLNFLYPAAAPMLYRFLCAFAPTRTYRGGLWDQLDRAGLAPADRPRVRLGGLVLDRRSWRLPVADLPALDGLERQELTALAEFDAWRRAAGLPRHAFFRVVAPPVRADGERDYAAETREWALQARSARLHKPHYLDAANPFLLHVLAKQARATPGGHVVVQECLPGAEGYASGAGSAEEFFVEHTLTGGCDAR